MTQSRSTAISAAIVAGVAVAAMLYVGRVVFVPMALALVLASVLGPLVARMEKARIPAPAGAALLLLGILALFTAAGLALSGPAQDWARKAPQAAAAAGKKVQSLRHRFDRLSALLVPRQAAQAPADSSHVPVQTDSAQAPATAEQPAPSSPRHRPARARMRSWSGPSVPPPRSSAPAISTRRCSCPSAGRGARLAGANPESRQLRGIGQACAGDSGSRFSG